MIKLLMNLSIGLLLCLPSLVHASDENCEKDRQKNPPPCEYEDAYVHLVTAIRIKQSVSSDKPTYVMCYPTVNIDYPGMAKSADTKPSNVLGRSFYMCVASDENAPPSRAGMESAKDDKTPKYQMVKLSNRTGVPTEFIFDNKSCAKKCPKNPEDPRPKDSYGPHDRDPRGELLRHQVQ